MKKILIALFVSIICISSAGAIDVYVDGQELSTDVPAQIIDGRTMVPIAPIFNALNATVSWDGATRTATGIKDGIKIDIQIDNTTAYVNGTPTTMDVPAKIVDGRTMVPVAFVSNELGANVSWNAEKQAVRIATKLYDVICTVDGDTIVVDIDGKEETVRLIGVDTPESVHPTASKNTEAGVAASAFTKIYLGNTKVELEFDIQERDKYDRLLAYVYCQNGEMFNEKLLRSGYASMSTYPPNVKHVDQFENIIKNRDSSLLSGEYDSGAREAPTMIYNPSADHNGLSFSILYADGEVVERKKIINVGDNENEEWQYIGLKTKDGIIDIFNPDSMSMISMSGGDHLYNNLKVGDSARVTFIYAGYYENTNRPEGYYISTLSHNKKNQPTNPDDTTNNDNSNFTGTVWVSRTGKRYHFIPTCSGMKNPRSMSLGSAKSAGYTPCSKCAH